MDCKNVISKTNSLSQPLAATDSTSRPFAAISLTFLLLTIVSGAVAQQKQLVILKNENVLARYQVGDVIHFAREKDKEILVQRILDMNDTLIMMNFDSVTYYRIKKLDIRARKSNTFIQKLGRYMILAGVLLPAIELLNTGVFQDEGQDAHVSPEILVVSGVLVGGGAIMAFT